MPLPLPLMVPAYYFCHYYCCTCSNVPKSPGYPTHRPLILHCSGTTVATKAMLPRRWHLIGLMGWGFGMTDLVCLSPTPGSTGSYTPVWPHTISPHRGVRLKMKRQTLNRLFETLQRQACRCLPMGSLQYICLLTIYTRMCCLMDSLTGQYLFWTKPFLWERTFWDFVLQLFRMGSKWISHEDNLGPLFMAVFQRHDLGHLLTFSMVFSISLDSLPNFWLLAGKGTCQLGPFFMLLLSTQQTVCWTMPLLVFGVTLVQHWLSHLH